MSTSASGSSTLMHLCCLMYNVKIACDLEDCVFICVDPVVRDNAPNRRYSNACSGLVTTRGSTPAKCILPAVSS